MVRDLYTHQRRRARYHGHVGTCERCQQRKPTARFKDNGETFVRLDNRPGGHWLCQQCVSDLEAKREVVRKGMDI